MKYLLDTNAFYLLTADYNRLSASYQHILADNASEFALSPASIWEMAIKVRLGKLDLNGVSLDDATGRLRVRQKIGLLSIRQSHLLRIATLPKVPGHGGQARVMRRCTRARECKHPQLPAQRRRYLRRS